MAFGGAKDRRVNIQRRTVDRQRDCDLYSAQEELKERRDIGFDGHRITTGRITEAKDNWQHRSANMRCRTCMYFVEKIFSQDEPHIEKKSPFLNDHPIGRCRRRAPTLNGWPVIFGSDWCGDHKLDETKI